MRHLTVPPKMVAFYCERSDRTIRRMCEEGKLESGLVGNEWVISSAGVKRRFWRLGRTFWQKVLHDVYPKDPKDYEEAYQEFLEIEAEEIAKERSRKRKRK